MSTRSCTDQEFIATWQRLGSATKVAQALGITDRATRLRRRRVERNTGVALEAAITNQTGGPTAAVAARLQHLARERQTRYERDMALQLADGCAIVFSDAHYWPGIVTTAHQALVQLARDLKPAAIVANGDILDGARISRHPRIGWEQQPALKDEIYAVQDRLGEIERAAPRATLIRTIGNHCARFENYLAANAPELEEMSGSTLLDYLPRWRAGWALHVNRQTDAWVAIRHRPVGGGVHSAYNSALKSGVSYVHGHLHKLQVTPWGDFRGRRYGVDTGTLAEPDGPQFTYCEAGPTNWCSGFAVLTWHRGRLLPPELCEVIAGTAWFRGSPVGGRKK